MIFVTRSTVHLHLRTLLTLSRVLLVNLRLL